ncbi:MAG TPA: sigma 54-interacting transcriptional regulator [Kofleriaceae bacterium]|nr:sigma 54-interacting transcriptional regulator [Kofleriaceae bacterium]
MAGAPASTQDDETRQRHVAVPARPYLFVVLHCDRPRAGSSRHDLAELDAIAVGRGTERTARRGPESGRRTLDLRLPGGTVSTTHARLERGDAGWTIADEGSKNGTFVNGERVTRAALRDGDLVEIGPTLLVYRAALPPPSEEGLAGPAGAPDLDSAALAALTPGLATLLPRLAEQHAALERIARQPIPVLLLGESGTGKEVLARAVHALSGRSGAFVGVNCGGIAATLLESQLFGHVKGAFTGAARDEPGLVRAADRGTLFLDEIGDLPLPAQAALLRVLQEREVVPVGGTRPVKVDLRIVAATHRPLDRMAAEGTFRADLLARLAGYRHLLPPLRARREDLGLILGDLLRCGEIPGATDLRLATAAGRRLFAHGWPLNIRELQQCLAVSAALAPRGLIEAEHLQLEGSLPAPAPASRSASAEPDLDLDDPEALRKKLVALLEQHRGNISHVARDLGKARMQIHRWLRRFDLDPAAFRG